MRNSQQLAPKWYDQRAWSLVVAGVAAVLVWLVLLRATDTGSLGQYGLALLLLLFAISKMGNVFKRKKNHSESKK